MGTIKRIFTDWITFWNSWVFIESTRKSIKHVTYLGMRFLSIFLKNSDLVKFCENSSAIITWLQKRRPTEKINWTLECNYTILSPREYRITFRVLEFFLAGFNGATKPWFDISYWCKCRFFRKKKYNLPPKFIRVWS